MRPIAIFYHVYLGGGEIPCDHDNVIGIVTDQLAALQASGVLDQAKLFMIGVTGDEGDVFMVQTLTDKAVVFHNKSGVGELPTMSVMQQFSSGNPGYNVLYFHTKGAIYKNQLVYTSWRRCMENAVIWSWKSIQSDLENGVDSCGAHWLTPQSYPIIGSVPYWGGNFFWAKSEFLNTLPLIDVNSCRYDAEVWIGRGKRKPKIRDYAHHWPGAACIR